ncbi:MAG TPA: Mur ligase domain-containing protein, partial [Saprospiraceae bacterium]|nr:Mur ligase domain-containing protein [Saprospiraceae bacterium]
MMELREYKHIYFLGIGGIGMSALAKLCLQLGIDVSGYDRQSSTITDQLTSQGAEIHFDDEPASIAGIPQLVIYTPAIPQDSKIRNYFIH